MLWRFCVAEVRPRSGASAWPRSGLRPWLLQLLPCTVSWGGPWSYRFEAGCFARLRSEWCLFFFCSPVQFSFFSCPLRKWHPCRLGAWLISLLQPAAAFSDAVTMVSGSACLSVAVFCIACATAAARSASFRFLCVVRDLVLSATWVVLGLRLRVSCDTSLVSQLFSWIFEYLDVFEDAQAFVKLLPIGGTTVLSAITTARGSRFACRAQATPRVDVDVILGYGGHDVPPPLLLQVLGTHNHPFKTSGRFQVFVKGLAGHTLVIAGCSGDTLVDDFMELVAMREGVPVACFYLVGAGSKALRLGTTLSDAGVVGTLFSLWRVVYEEAPLVRDLRQCLAPGIVTCATWEGAGQRGTRVFGVLRSGYCASSAIPL